MDRVSFRIHSAELKTEQITQALGVVPHKVLKKGEPLSKRHPSGQPRPENMWIWEPNSIGLDAQLGEVADFVRKHEQVFTEDLMNCNFDVQCTLFVEESQRSFVISAKNLQPLVQIGADILMTALSNG